MRQWYPGDGRVLPLEEALKLVSALVRQEISLRVALAAGDAIPVPVAEATSTGVCVRERVRVRVCRFVFR